MLKINYHNITKDDMLNGSGLRIVLWVSGCENHCRNCQNKQTWDINSGIPFTNETVKEIWQGLSNDYISGITFSGGDPLHPNNITQVFNLCKDIKIIFEDKNIWLYTGYQFEDIWIPKNCVSNAEFDFERGLRNDILKYIDVLVDGKFVPELADINYHWAGSSNQRIIDVQKTLQEQKVALFDAKT